MPAAIPLMIGLTAASTAISVTGQIKGGNAAARAGVAQREAANSQADLADFNAHVADLQAVDAVERGAQEESRYRAGVRGLVGSQRAGYAAGNIDVGVGSAVDVQADTAFQGELDALTIRGNAMREAWGYKVGAEDLRTRAKIARKEGVFAEQAGKEAKSASRWAAAGTIAGTGASLLDLKYGSGSKDR